MECTPGMYTALGRFQVAQKLAENVSLCPTRCFLFKRCPLISQDSQSEMPAPHPMVCNPQSQTAFCKSPSCVSHDLPRDFIHFCPSSLPSPEFACVHIGLVAVMGHTVSTASSTRFSTHHKEYPQPLYLTLYTVCFLALRKHYCVFLL